ncbi:MAG TPA: 3-deoxy-manno-octulosonate cytidylyltransferase [Spirochaetia bacterium]|nr:3-deoxy-manno-octulosonate cytidylyltransferase [Spirochaetia bacterium]
MKVIGVIPARYESSRLPGKPLADIIGKPMIQWVYETASKSKLLTELVVATDDERIVGVVRAFGGRAVMTDPNASTGSDRVAEVVRNRDEDIVVNIQGDEPFLDPLMIDEIVAPLANDPELPMCTSMHEVLRSEDFNNPNVVKVVTDVDGNALYFSRSLIPFPRKPEGHQVFEHIGIYAYRRQFLLTLASLPQTPLEKLESLEQLRVIECGHRLRVVETKRPYIALSVDTPEDLETARDHARRLVGGEV